MTDLGDRLRRLPADTLTALAFFSRLPVAAPAGSFDLHQSAGAWPLAGLAPRARAGGAVLRWLRAADLPAAGRGAPCARRSTRR